MIAEVPHLVKLFLVTRSFRFGSLLPAATGIQFPCMLEGLWVSSNGGVSWQYVDTLPARSVRYIDMSSAHPLDHTILFVSTYRSGNPRSTCGDASWALANTSLQGPHTCDSGVSPNSVVDKGRRPPNLLNPIESGGVGEARRGRIISQRYTDKNFHRLALEPVCGSAARGYKTVSYLCASACICGYLPTGAATPPSAKNASLWIFRFRLSRT